MTERTLISCPSCHRQVEVGQASPIQCRCGAELPGSSQLRRSDLEVLRCSACGAPRVGQKTACTFCRASFHLRESDLDSQCPACGHRIDSRGLYCHRCGVPNRRQDPQAATELLCPVCGDGHPLFLKEKRAAPEEALLECYGCAGIWLDWPLFRQLDALARNQELKQLPQHRGIVTPPSLTVASVRHYDCVRCEKKMARFNYGRESGVVVDSCREHGIWFDYQELPRLLLWVRGGGPETAQRNIEREAIERDRIQNGTAQDRATYPLSAGTAGVGSEDFLGTILDIFVDASPF